MRTFSSSWRTGAVLLAAGEGRRLGGAVKGAIELGGEPLLARALRTLRTAAVDEIVVVLGHGAAQLGPLAAPFAVRLLEHAGYRDGQASSVQAGLAALGGPFDAVLVCLVDQPLLLADDLRALIAAFAARRAGEVMLPYWQGQRGNPAIFSERVRQSGAPRAWIDAHPHQVLHFAAPNDHYVVDLDTPDDLAALQARLSGAARN
jgi:CTP:molybdopterin cytidylyltransferase MocA